MFIKTGKNNVPIFVVITLSCVLCSTVSLSETDSERQSTAVIEIGSDNAGGSEYRFNIDHMLDDTHQIFASYGNQPTIDNLPNTIKKSYSFGVEDQAETRINSGFRIDWWGNKDILTIRSLSAVLRINADNYSITLTPIIQRIHFEDIVIRGVVRSFDINSEGWGLSMLYFFPNNSYFLLRRNEYKFYVRGTEFSDSLPESLDNFLANGPIGAAPLERSRNTFTFGTELGRLDVSLDWAESKPLVGGKISKQINVSVDYPMSDTISLLVQFGRIKTDAEINLKYSSLAATFVW